MNSSTNPSMPAKSFTAKAFTLIEILAVIVVIGLLLSLTVPSMVSAINSTRLGQAGEEIYGILGQAQQLASSRGRPVEVRFYRIGNATAGEVGANGEVNGYRAIMVLSHYLVGDADPSNPSQSLTSPISLVELGGAVKLPSSVLISETPALSPLITNAPTVSASASDAKLKLRSAKSGDNSLSDYSMPTSYDRYSSFLCLPESTNLNPDAGQKWFLTLVGDRDAAAAASDLKNFVTLQIHAVTGLISVYRP